MTLTEKEIRIQLYLHERLSEDGLFLLKVIHAKEVNKLAVIEHLYKGKTNPIVEEMFRVTPQEELFRDFFNNEKAEIANMSTLELRAHREELAKIAFEARARLTAVDEEDRARKAKAQREKGPTGFSTSLQTDDITSQAINAVKERQKRMSKADKIMAGLEKLGIDTKEAQKIMSAGTILAKVKSAAVSEPIKPVVNPFAPKPAEPTVATEVSINEETNTIVVTKEPEQPTTQPTTGFVNPFAK